MRISDLTKDCKRDDCRIVLSMGGASTCLAWVNEYDKTGRLIGRGDPNVTMTSTECLTCGVRWEHRTQYGETTTTRVDPKPTDQA